MPAPVPRMHGLSHDHGGPDPSRLAWDDVGSGSSGGGSGGIAFDTDNVGGSLSVTTTGSTGVVDYGIHLVEYGSNIGIRIDSNANVNLNAMAGGAIDLYSHDPASPGALSAADSRVVIDSSGVSVKLPTGGTFEVLDPALGLVLRIVQGSPNLHIKTGGIVVADL